VGVGVGVATGEGERGEVDQIQSQQLNQSS